MNFKQHATLGGSTADRWIRCPGSVYMGYNAEENKQSQDGTLAHEIARKLLVDEPLTEEEKGFFGYQYILDYIESVKPWFDKGFVFIEQKLDLTERLGVESFGTPDFICITDDSIHVDDFKFGFGKVEARDNYQLLYYLVGFLNHWVPLDHLARLKNFILTIHQPRLNIVDSWSPSFQEVSDFVYKMEDAAKIHRQLMSTDSKTEHLKHLHPGEKQCQDCPVKAYCPALTNTVLNTVTDDVVNYDVDLAAQMESIKTRLESADNQTLANLLGAVDMIRDWCDTIEKRAFKEVVNGNVVPGYKLVKGRPGHKKWVDDPNVPIELVALSLNESIYTNQLKSPAQIEQAIKNRYDRVKAKEVIAGLQRLTTREDGKSTLVKSTDKREAITTESDFDNL